MPRFYATFGQQHPREPHDLFVGADHDGWVAIIAENETKAARVLGSWLGTGYSMLYSEEPSSDTFPRGCLATLIDERPDDRLATRHQ